MNFLIKYVGGSHLYGLNTPESDIDYRGVYLHSDMAKILRFDVEDNVSETQEDGDDYAYYELNRYMQLLRKTNTQSVETLFVKPSETIEDSRQFAFIREQRYSLIDTEKLISSAKGYTMSETRLALGERAGRMGGKRRGQLELYGFSPKNVCQIIRIVAATEHFMKEKWYPLNLDAEGLTRDHELAFQIKTRPWMFGKGDIKRICEEFEKRVLKIEDTLKLSFNQDVAVELMREAYEPYFK
mgnify:CR=1 FL=1|tara:strand:+ start:514 stop:1236 length:723 start_codon:yes stop_codon:yes gene_type:complete